MSDLEEFRSAVVSVSDLAIRGVLHQADIHTAIVSARTPDQLAEMSPSLKAKMPNPVFDALTAINDEAIQHIPDMGKPYRYYPENEHWAGLSLCCFQEMFPKFKPASSSCP